MSVAVANCLKLFVKLSNFKGNSDIERYQMANKKIPFKYTRPVEDWLQDKGKSLSNFQNVLYFLSFHRLVPFQPLRMNNHPLNPLKKTVNQSNLFYFVCVFSLFVLSLWFNFYDAFFYYFLSLFLSLSSLKKNVEPWCLVKGTGK